jgi:rhamnose transport system ATP-binding protein
MTVSEQALVDLARIHKSYAGREALRGITMSLKAGEVHAFVGENGAGKSTLARVIAGATRPDRGEIRIDDKAVSLGSPRLARQHGIALVTQELSLVSQRPVVENVLAGQLPTWGPGLVSKRAMHRSLDALLARSGLDLPADELVGNLNPVQQQFVEILRAMAGEARLLILDEPTTMMTRDQADKVMSLVRRLASSGVGVVFISHTLEDVLAVSDQVSVLRDGLLVRTAPARESTLESMITAMIGGRLDEQYPARRPVPDGAPVMLRARGISRGHAVRDVDLTVRAGEILGIAGLAGSGRSELLRCLIGADRRDSGSIEIYGAVRRQRGVREAMSRGMVMIPEDRKLQGLHLEHSVERNITLPHLADLRRAGLMRRRSSLATAHRGLAAVNISGRYVRSPVLYLSGGNQQRVLFAKWLVGKPQVILADEPTRGVDVAGKRAIYDLLAGLAADGAAVIVVSSELPEVVGLSHRVLVMLKGRVAAELTGEEIVEQRIIAAAFGDFSSGSAGSD